MPRELNSECKRSVAGKQNTATAIGLPDLCWSSNVSWILHQHSVRHFSLQMIFVFFRGPRIVHTIYSEPGSRMIISWLGSYPGYRTWLVLLSGSQVTILWLRSSPCCGTWLMSGHDLVPVSWLSKSPCYKTRLVLGHGRVPVSWLGQSPGYRTLLVLSVIKFPNND